MGEIAVEFVGICTHIQFPQGLFTTQHRVVLVNSDAQRIAAEHHPRIEKHHPRVEIRQGTHVLYGRDLNGAAVAIDGALDGALTYDFHYNCALPRLLMEGFTDSANLSPRVKDSPDASLVSGLIDLPNASFTAQMREDGAAVGVATVQIEGPRQISIQSFAGAAEIIDERIPVPEGAVVVFSNHAEGRDDDHDFHLNFLIFDPVPDVKRNVMRRVCPGIPPHQRHGWGSIGPGCSNTNFP